MTDALICPAGLFACMGMGEHSHPEIFERKERSVKVQMSATKNRMARRRPLDVSVSNVNRFACDWYIVVMSAAYSNGTLVVSNRYDHLGRRVQKIAMDGTHTFLYDGWRPVVETVARASGGTDRIEYHWGKDLSGTLDGAAGVGGLLYVRRNGAIYVPFYDAFGNVMGYWDSNDAVVAEYAYDAFGRMAAKSGIMADMFSIRYSTKYYDAETGMYYYGKRFYMTSLCRWLTRDPIEEEGGVNLYSNCNNELVCSFDASGLTPEASTFKSNYEQVDYSKTGAQVWRMVGGSLKQLLWPDESKTPPNSCATRVSVALIKRALRA